MKLTAFGLYYYPNAKHDRVIIIDFQEIRLPKASFSTSFFAFNRENG